MPYRANVVAMSGSGRARTKGSAESTRIRAATVSGAALASSTQIMPPIELPIRMTGFFAAAGTDPMKRCSSARFANTLLSRPASRVRPNPARSGAISR